MKFGIIAILQSSNDNHIIDDNRFHYPSKRSKWFLQFKKTVFLDRFEVFIVGFVSKGNAINTEAYCNNLKKSKVNVQNRQRGLVEQWNVSIHDNVTPHTSLISQKLLISFGLDFVKHPPMFLDLAPSNMFTKFKELKRLFH